MTGTPRKSVPPMPMWKVLVIVLSGGAVFRAAGMIFMKWIVG